MDRGLDGVYFRVKDETGKKVVNKCWSDMTLEQKQRILDNKNRKFVLELTRIMVEENKKLLDFLNTENDKDYEAIKSMSIMAADMLVKTAEIAGVTGDVTDDE